MSQNNQNQQNRQSWVKTAATFAVGALAGAAVAGFTYYASTEGDRENQRRQHQNLQPRNSSGEPEEKKVDGVVKACEICFIDFEDLKSNNVHIMATRPCGHVFCRVCIEETLMRRPNCPHCRQPVEIRDLQRLYI